MSEKNSCSGCCGNLYRDLDVRVNGNTASPGRLERLTDGGFA